MAKQIKQVAKESEVQRTILDYLEWTHVFHYRNNSGALKTQSGGFVRFGALGSPDIICVVNGQFVGIECKRKGSHQTDSQKQFQGRLQEAGGKYILAYGLEDVEKVLTSIT